MGLVAKDPKALAQLTDAMAKLGGPEFKRALVQRLRAAAVKLLADQFRGSTDPYGNRWAPLKRRKGKPLLDTGRLRAAAVATAAGSGGSFVRLVIPVEYASYHQKGTHRIPRRQIVPEESTGGLGPIWGKTMEQEAAKLVDEAMAKVK